MTVLTRELLAKLEETVNNPLNPVKYLSIDPGKANGVCGYDINLYPLFMMTVPSNLMIQFLYKFKNVRTCICESYVLYPGKKSEMQRYSDMETSRVIGRIEGWAELHNVELVKQGASVKPNGYAWLGKKPLPKSNPNNHFTDAHAHFIYWAVRHGKMNAADLIRDGNTLLQTPKGTNPQISDNN